MTTYNRSRVVSVRLDPELLEAVRTRAKSEGRSLSGEIVFILRDRVKAEPRQRQRRTITGWLRHVASPKELGEFRSGRESASAALLRAVRRKARDK